MCVLEGGGILAGGRRSKREKKGRIKKEKKREIKNGYKLLDDF